MQSFLMKLIGIIGLLAGVAFGSYLAGGASVEPQVITEYRDREVLTEAKEKIVYKDRIITRIVTQKPDGTIITKEETRERDKQKDKETNTKSHETVQASRPAPSTYRTTHYALGIRVMPSIHGSDYKRTERYEVNVGYRIGELPLFGEAGYADRDKQLTLGVRYEW